MADWKDEHLHPGDVTLKEAKAGILPSHRISIDIPGVDETGRPPVLRHLSSPAYQSPLRHHRRTPSQRHKVKETLNARSEYTNSESDGKFQHRINQYMIKEEIGRGSFGAVHLAVDHSGQEYAVKEFSKSRLRKRAQSSILRRPHSAGRGPGHLAAGKGLNAPLHQHHSPERQDGDESANPLYLIKEEIAIMKKLDHPNLVSLIEVLDDPDEDSLYMVLEMCKKGVVMKVGLEDTADPYDAESCRYWFRDLILGIEYLHAQGVVHRDIKPDNLLLTEDDVLKVVDFGVSEMFEKQSEMMTAKSAGSPAFLPPELCVAKHGDISGKAADIWSMGVSLYCLRHGRIPFEKPQLLELFEAIKNDDVNCSADDDAHFLDLMHRLLEKDPKKRIFMNELREHPWVTKGGTDPLLSKEENVESLVELPTKAEVNHAITLKFKNLMTVMKAVGKFKSLLLKRRPELLADTLGSGVRTVQSPLSMQDAKDTEISAAKMSRQESPLYRSHSVDLDNRRTIDGALAAEGIHRDVSAIVPEPRSLAERMDSCLTSSPNLGRSGESSVQHDGYAEGHWDGAHSDHHDRHTMSSDHPTPRVARDNRRSHSTGGKGQAHDPMDHDLLWLGIGIGAGDTELSKVEAVAESPSAAEFNIYDAAYQNEVERIRKAQGLQATVYLTRRVDRKKEYKADEHMINAPKAEDVAGQPHAGWKGLVDAAREKDSHEPIPQAEQVRLGVEGAANSTAHVDGMANSGGDGERGGSGGRGANLLSKMRSMVTAEKS
ncbi:MAG: hypothetical protein M1818_000217 [Claussenomyces sp. TS43310]|nr:MAG: hypothetical protein M1818_000217 [Claussenomyces sp. TS43310]